MALPVLASVCISVDLSRILHRCIGHSGGITLPLTATNLSLLTEKTVGVLYLAIS
jgi:hypothetical protein